MEGLDALLPLVPVDLVSPLVEGLDRLLCEVVEN